MYGWWSLLKKGKLKFGLPAFWKLIRRKAYPKGRWAFLLAAGLNSSLRKAVAAAPVRRIGKTPRGGIKQGSLTGDYTVLRPITSLIIPKWCPLLPLLRPSLWGVPRPKVRIIVYSISKLCVGGSRSHFMLSNDILLSHVLYYIAKILSYVMVRELWLTS